MRRSFKTLLLWLLLLALPVQGFAAVAMRSFHANPLPAAATMAAAHHDNHDSHAMHDGHHGHHQHDQCGQHASPVADTAHHVHHDGTHPHGKHDASTSCSACAACCIGAVAPPAGLNTVFLRNSSELVLASPSPFMTGFIPADIERPPRLLSL